MKKLLALLLILPLLLCCIGSAAPGVLPAEPESVRLSLQPSQIQDECTAFLYSGYTTLAGTLLNEQEKLPETPDGALLEAPSSANWQPLKKSDYCPIRCLIDLGEYYKITAIGLYDTNGVTDFTVRMGTPFAWTQALSIKTDAYRCWRVFSVEPISTRYLQLESSFFDSGVNEIAFYGYRDADHEREEPPAAEGERALISADQAIGANGFIDDPQDVLGVLGNLREYHNLSWTSQAGERVTFHTPWWDFDSYYAQLASHGVEAIPCIQGTVDWILGNGEAYASSNNIPVPDGADPADPASYRAHASVMFQYAARYGHTEVDESKLRLADGETAKTGLGCLTYYENFNEQNKNWEGKASYQSPYEYAAMASADYDGHEGTLGETYGIKNADPNAKLAMGGLVGDAVIEYLEGMKFWFTHNRQDQKFVPDVINFHKYVENDCPERSDFQAYLSALAQWRDENLPDKELWCSEFNVTAEDKVLPDVPNGENQAYLDAHAERLVRAYLLGLASGVDRLSMFMSRDTDGGAYEDDGLVTKKGEWNKKPAWYYTATLKHVLTDMRFDSVISQTDQVYLYRFAGIQNSNQEVYALWSPTTDGSAIDAYSLHVGENVQATLLTLEDGEAQGVSRPLTVLEGKVTVCVTEKPVFICVKKSSPSSETLSLSCTVEQNEVTLEAQPPIAFVPTTYHCYLLGEGRIYYKETGSLPVFHTLLFRPGSYTAVVYAGNENGKKIKGSYSIEIP